MLRGEARNTQVELVMQEWLGEGNYYRKLKAMENEYTRWSEKPDKSIL
jgi:hypothetical protein